MTLGRRKFVVATVGAATLSSLLAGCDDGGSSGTPQGKELTPDELRALSVDGELFAHGVASGDPLSDRVILWTRVSVRGQSKHTLTWLVASDPELQQVVSSGTVDAEAERDFTAKVDVTGLSPGTTYYYAFALAGRGRTRTGRTRTLPEADTAHVRFAFTSCANYNNGFFHAYHHIAKRHDLDVWIHLGDYIYEYADGVYGDPTIGRRYDPPGETIMLADYRARYAQYRTDPDLQELHRQHPLIAVWDDHEVADNASLVGAVNHDASEGDYQARKRAGAQAFLEWLPIRVTDDSSLPARIYRSFPFGNLFDLIMIDTRLIGRDLQAGGLESPGDPAVWVDPSRHLLGAEQESWLNEQLKNSRDRRAVWRVLGNQVIFAENINPLTNEILNADAWDGYQPARSRVVSELKKNGVDNLVVLTGDIHTSWAFDLAENPFDPANYDPATGRGSFGVELVTPAVTSRGLEEPEDAERRTQAETFLAPTHPHLKLIEVTRKGYVLVDVTDQRVQAEWYFVGDHKGEDDAARAEELAKVLVCRVNTHHLEEGSEASKPKQAPTPAPA